MRSVLLFAGFLSIGANFTGRRYQGSKLQYESRQHRLLNFNTDQEGDLAVDLEFSVPFLKIPVKRSLETAKGAIANVNVGALLLTSGLLLATFGLFPAFSWFFSKKPSCQRGSDDDKASWRALVEVEPGACLGKLVCWTVQGSTKRVRNGRGGSFDKVVDGVVSGEWFWYLLEGTEAERAVKSGLQGIDCAKKYQRCRVNGSHLNVFGGED